MIILSPTMWFIDDPGDKFLEQERLRILPTPYSPELGGINCDSNCDVVASGLSSGPHLSGRAAACPDAWTPMLINGHGKIVGTETTVVHFPEWTGLDPQYCVDTFGSRENGKEVLYHSDYYHNEYEYELVLRMDFYVDDVYTFPYTLWLLDGWWITREPVPSDWLK